VTLLDWDDGPLYGSEANSSDPQHRQWMDYRTNQRKALPKI
jgi:hypothetical protein